MQKPREKLEHELYLVIEEYALDKQVKDKMKEIKRLIRRTRNIMEEQNLRRELDTYSRRLAELRRNS